MKTLALAVTILLMVALLVPAVAKDMPDVPFGHWAYDAVDELTDLGVVEGYPDGTFKGDRTWTRYEFATMLVRMIDFLEDYLDDKVAGMDMGITESAARAIAREEAQKAAAGIQLPDVQAFMNQVKSTATSAGAAAAREALAGYKPGISKAEAQAMIDAAVKNFVDKGALDAMAQEFRGELAMLGADVDDLMYRVDALETKFAALEARVTALENKPDKVTGELEWKVGSVEPLGFGMYGPYARSWERFSNLSVKINVDGKISDKAQGHITIWRPDATYDWDERGTHIDTAYVDVQDGLFKGVDWRFGKQYFKTGYGLVFDNDIQPSEAVKLNFQLGALDLTGFFGWTDCPYGFGDEDPTYVGEAKYNIGRLTLDGTYVFRSEIGAKRWGIAAGYNGLDVPFFGVKANLKGEFGEILNATGGKSPPGSIDNAYFARADFMGNGYEPGDFKLGVSWSEQQRAYNPWLWSGSTYDHYVHYGSSAVGSAWDFLLGENFQVGGLLSGTRWTGEIEKDLGNVGLFLRYAQMKTWGAPEYSKLYQLALDKELADGVNAKLTYARIDYGMLDTETDYFGGSINVDF